MISRGFRRLADDVVRIGMHPYAHSNERSVRCLPLDRFRLFAAICVKYMLTGSRMKAANVDMRKIFSDIALPHTPWVKQDGGCGEYCVNGSM